jgi:hypothetical protein
MRSLWPGDDACKAPLFQFQTASVCMSSRPTEASYHSSEAVRDRVSQDRACAMVCAMVCDDGV